MSGRSARYGRGSGLRAGLLAAASLGVLVGAATSARAQDDSSAVEEVVVTGTQIRGIAPVGAAPISLTPADIRATGQVDTLSVLKTVPQISTLGVNDTTTGTTANGGSTNTSAGSGVNIRGFGTQATLTLLNGRRGAPGGAFSLFFEPSVIPAIALGGIEVLSDGASATYGSDAVAGVVNLILKRNLNGGQVDATFGGAKGGYHTERFAAVYGRTWSTGQFMIAGERSFRSKLTADKRPDLYIADGPGVFAGNGALPRGYTNFGLYPNIRVGSGAATAYYAAQPNATSAAGLIPNAQNTLGLWYDSTIVPEQTRYSTTGQFDQKLTSWAKVYGQGFYSYREFYQYGATQGSTSANLTLNVPSTNPFFIAGVPGVTTSETVLMTADRLIGQQKSTGYEKAWQIVGGFTFDLPFEWQADVSHNYAGSRDQRYRANGSLIPCAITGGAACLASQGAGEILVNGAYPGAIAQTNPQFAFNPFGANSTYVLNRVWADLYQNNFYDVNLTAAKVDGPLFDLPAGKVRAAIGFEYQKDREGQHNYNVDATTNARPQGGELNYTQFKADITSYVRTVYGEVVAPLVGPENAMPGIRRLEVSGAVRYSNYSIINGSTTNPKFGVTWAPAEDLTIRGTYGTSFRINLTAADPNSVALLRAIPTYNDYKFGVTTAIQRGGGNSDVKPETARTFTIGADYKPSKLPGFRANLTYFNVRYEDRIEQAGSPVFATLTAAQESLYGQYVTRRPSLVTPGASDTAFNAQVAALIASTAPAFAPPFPAVGTVNLIVDARFQNAGTVKTHGVDFSAGYDFDTSVGKLSVGLIGSYLFNWKVSITPTAPLIDRVNNIDFPTRYRLRGAFGWQRGGFSANAFVNYIPSYKNTNISLTAPPKIASYLTVDASVSYDTQDKPGMAALRNIVVTLSASNLFDKDPPFAVVANQNFDSTYASQIGRIINLQLSKRF
jgi:iron complex outermembrane receptor protein